LEGCRCRGGVARFCTVKDKRRGNLTFCALCGLWHRYERAQVFKLRICQKLCVILKLDRNTTGLNDLVASLGTGRAGEEIAVDTAVCILAIADVDCRTPVLILGILGNL
jgi:hypothetical protein